MAALLLFIRLPSLPLYHFDRPKIEHQCLAFNFNLDLDHSAQGCNTSELDFVLTKHCRRVAHLCKHGPCSVCPRCLHGSPLCLGHESFCLCVLELPPAPSAFQDEGRIIVITRRGITHDCIVCTSTPGRTL